MPKTNGTVPAKTGIDHKQTGASYSRHQAVRNEADGHGPEADKDGPSERAQALAPSDRKRANKEPRAGGPKTASRLPTEQPMGDEIPLSGLDDTPKGRQRPDGDPAKEAHMGTTAAQSSTKTSGAKAEAAPKNERPEEKRQRELTSRREKFSREAKAMTLEELTDKLPVGSSIEVRGHGVDIRAAIAGGGIRVFSGKDLAGAMASMAEEEQHGPQSIDDAVTRNEPTRTVATDEGTLSPDPAKTAEAEEQDRQKAGTATAKQPAAKSASRSRSGSKQAAAKKAGAKKARR